MLTLADLQTTRFQTASGYGTASTDFLEIINDAVDGLIIRGDFKGTVIPILLKLNVVTREVTFPRFVGEVRKINSLRHGTIDVRNQSYRFLDHRGHHRDWERWRGDELNADYQLRVPTLVDVPTSGCVLQFAPSVTQDNGATCTVFGADTSGNPLQTQNGDGTWSPGIIIVASTPFGQSTVQVGRIDRIVMTATNSTKTLSAYNPTTLTTTTLSVYGATETEPSYLRYRFSDGSRCCGTYQATVLAQIKLATHSIQNPTDLVIIDNREALLDAIKAIKRADASDDAGSDKLWASAVEKLNRQLENESDDSTFAASDNTWGDSRCFTNQAF